MKPLKTQIFTRRSDGGLGLSQCSPLGIEGAAVGGGLGLSSGPGLVFVGRFLVSLLDLGTLAKTMTENQTGTQTQTQTATDRRPFL